MQKQIIWKKWVDPFEKYDDDETYEGDDEYKKEKDFRIKPNDQMNPFLVGPMGVIPLGESVRPGKLYNFWMAHTNFPITYPVKNLLENIAGVETLDVFTRYRARIGFGVVFDAEEVKNNISNSLCVEKEEFGLRAFLDKKYKNWVVLIDEKGKQEIFSGEKKDLEKMDTKNFKVFRSWTP